MLVKYFCIFILFSLLTGCTTFMSASYSSKVDPDYYFSRNDYLLVTYDNKANPLESKYYIGQVVEGLKRRGFSSVYSYKNKEDSPQPFKGILFVSVNKKSSSYEYDSANYGMVDSGKSTTNCTGYGYSVNCTENKQKTYGVTGHSTKTGYLTGYYFSLDWYDIKTEERVLNIFSSSYEKRCSDDKLYSFIVNETMSRIDFNKPNKYEYKVKMPKNYTCK